MAKSKPTNIVVFMSDDIGLGDIGYYHQQRTGKTPVVPTPNIDNLIKNGMQFTDAHSPASLCAPTRFRITSYNVCYTKLLRCNRAAPVWRIHFRSGLTPQRHTADSSKEICIGPATELHDYIVITSYSIHYTKLYEATCWSRPCTPAARWRR